MKFENRSKNIKFNQPLINSLSKQFNVSSEIIKIIYTKGYTTKKDIVKFLQPQNFKWHNPYLLSGMNEAVEIINNAVKQKHRITILGDYDTDGICSTAILYKYFESKGINVNYFLPNRFVDGYGLTMDTIDKIEEMYKPDLLITVDCGISSYAEIEYAKSKGILVLVTDHHEVPEQKPDCVIVNPKVNDQKYPFKDLCGAGVALKVVQALQGFEKSKPYVAIAAIATVADIVALKDENRAIVHQGLQSYKTDFPVGVLKLLEKLKLNDLQSTDIAFKLAPKINTAGRMGDANIAFRLFVEKNIQKIANNINKLNDLNEQRVNDGANIYDECIEMLEKTNISNLGMIVLVKDDWNGGVLGIVCAKLVEKYNKPVCLISRVENEYKGSVRSIEGIDIYDQLSKVSHLLIRFGGHNQAGGLSIEKENIDEFVKLINENIKNQYQQKNFIQVKYYDMDINKVELNQKFVDEIAMLEPFGFGNEKPIFKLTFNNAKVERMKNYDNHLKVNINNLNLISFNSVKYENILQTNSTKHILIELNTKYNNRKSINGIIKYIDFEKLNTNLKNEVVQANYLTQLNYLNVETNIKYNILTQKNFYDTMNVLLKKSIFGTLIVTNNFANYEDVISKFGKYIVNYEIGDLLNTTGENSILYAPDYKVTTSHFKTVVFLEQLLCEGYLNNFSAKDIYIYNSIPENKLPTVELDASREVFGVYHKAIVHMTKNNIIATNKYNYFKRMQKFNPQYKKFRYDMFTFVVMVLVELGILTEIDEVNYRIKINKNIKSNLENSTIYNFIKTIKKSDKKNK